MLLGGVLKGQELITGARVRNLIQQQDGVKAAYFGFLDRFRALPGDYRTPANISITGAVSGTREWKRRRRRQDRVRRERATKTSSLGSTLESGIHQWHLHLCAYNETSARSPSNPYGHFSTSLRRRLLSTGTATKRHNLKTGGQIASDILAEIDRKVDDGNAGTGSFRAQKNAAVDERATNATAQRPERCLGVTSPGRQLRWR